MSPDPLLVPTLIIFAVLLVPLAVVVLLVGGARRRRLRRRLARIGGRAAGMVQAPVEADIRAARPGGAAARLERWVARLLPRPQALRDRLARTGRHIPLGLYLALTPALGLPVLLVLLGLSLAPLPASGLAVAAGIALPHLAVGFMVARRRGRFVALLPDAIDLIVRGVRSGLPVGEQLATVGTEVAEPVGGEFRRIAHEVRFGKPLEEALQRAAARLAIADFNFFVVSLAVQRETGGNLGETLNNLSDVLRKRRQMKLKVRAMAAEAYASALILGSMPVILFVVLMLMNHGYAGLLFSDPRGRIASGGALVLEFIGVLVMARMVRFQI